MSSRCIDVRNAVFERDIDQLGKGTDLVVDRFGGFEDGEDGRCCDDVVRVVKGGIDGDARGEEVSVD
jgi:hypothetical protein